MIFHGNSFSDKLIIRLTYIPPTAQYANILVMYAVMHLIFTIVHLWIMEVKTMPTVNVALRGAHGEITNEAHAITKFTNNMKPQLPKNYQNSKIFQGSSFGDKLIIHLL